MEHINWSDDVRLLTIEEVQRVYPDVKRVFLDASPYHDHIRQSAGGYVDAWWDKDAGSGMTMRKALYPMNKKAAVEFFIREWTRENSPTVMGIGTFLDRQV